MYRGIPRLRLPRFRSPATLIVPHLKSKALNSWSSVQGRYSATKEKIEKHKVVFTVATSAASVLTAWAGYSLRHIHQSRVDQRLKNIEKAMNSKDPLDDPELKKIVSRTVSYPACVATAGTSLAVGYFFGWRSGTWYRNQRLRREQMKLLGLIKPRRWPLRLLKRKSVEKIPEPVQTCAKGCDVHCAGANQNSMPNI